MKPARYFLASEPLHEDLGELELDGIGWVVIGTDTGKRKGKIDAKAEWVMNITKQAQKYRIPAFMKATLAGVVGEAHLIQDFPATFHRIFDLK